MNQYKQRIVFFLVSSSLLALLLLSHYYYNRIAISAANDVKAIASGNIGGDENVEQVQADIDDLLKVIELLDVSGCEKIKFMLNIQYRVVEFGGLYYPQEKCSDGGGWRMPLLSDPHETALRAKIDILSAKKRMLKHVLDEYCKSLLAGDVENEDMKILEIIK